MNRNLKILCVLMFSAIACFSFNSCSSDDDVSIADTITGVYSVRYSDVSGEVSTEVSVSKVTDVSINVNIPVLEYDAYSFGNINVVCPVVNDDEGLSFEGSCNVMATRVSYDATCYISGWADGEEISLAISISGAELDVDIDADGNIQKNADDDKPGNVSMDYLLLGVWRATHYDGAIFPSNYIMKWSFYASGNYIGYSYIPKDEEDDSDDPVESVEEGVWSLKGNELWIDYGNGRMGYTKIIELKDDFMVTRFEDEGESTTIKWKKINFFN